MPAHRDEDLLRFLADGSPQAFERLIDRHTPIVLAVCRGRLPKRPDLIGGMMQRTWVTLYEKATTIHGSLSAWFGRVATNAAHDLMRREQSQHRRQEHWVCDRDQDARHELLRWIEASDALPAAMETLKPVDRTLLARRFLQQAGLTESAAESNVSMPTMSRRVAASRCCGWARHWEP
jgi:RNA polymerase sigma factor (sigma-70 family)